nr:MAG TPA: hypothetical protein [Bacteriophage sp.]
MELKSVDWSNSTSLLPSATVSTIAFAFFKGIFKCSANDFVVLNLLLSFTLSKYK